MGNKKKLDLHVFVCTNKKESGNCCANRGSEKMRNDLKALCKDPSYHGRVRVNASGCLGRCEEGIAAVFYPEGKWFENLTSDSAPEIFEEMKKRLS